MALNIVLSLALVNPLAFGGLALANTLATTLETAVLFWLLRRRIGGIDERALASAAFRMLTASLVMGLCLFAFVTTARGWHIGLTAIGVLLVGGLSYFGMALALRIGEASRLPQILRP